MKKIFSIKTKILLVISIIIIFIGSITALLVFYLTSNILINRNNGSLKKLAIEQKHEITAYLSLPQLLVKSIAGQSDISEYLENPNKISKTKLTKIFDDYKLNNNQYLAFYLLDKNGTAVISSDRTFLDKNYSFREYFKDTIVGKPVVTALLGVTSNKFGYYFSYPVKSNDKKSITGVVVAKLSDTVIEEPLINSQISQEGSIMLVDQMGVILYSKKSERFLNVISPLNKDELMIIKKENRYGNKLGKSLKYNLIKNAINQNKETSSFRFFDKLDKGEEMIILNKIDNSPYFLIIEFDYKNIKREAFYITLYIAGGVLFSAIISLIAISYLVIKILDPLNKINYFTEKINKDNFHERIKIKSNDEFEKLSMLLNKMLDNIEDLYKNLEKKVADKTFELNNQVNKLEQSKIATLNLLEDVEEEKNKSDKLAKDLEKFKQAVANASDHIIITDSEGIILYANKAVEKITGFSIEDIIGKKAGILKLWGGLMPKMVYKKFWDIIKIKKNIYIGEFNNKRKNGENYVTEAHVSPILDENNKVQFFVGIERDITKAKEVDRMKTEFISLASHQLRTPLSAMKWFTEMLLAGDMGKLNKEQNEAINNIEQSNQRMIELVNSLLNISRIESGRIIIDPKPTNIGELLKNTVKALKNKIDEKKITLSISIHPKLPLINLDEKLIREVYSNLLTNAIKYTPEEGEINIFISKKDNNIISQIQDSGYGIPKNQQSKIFEKFFRADNITKIITDGNGLGLYLIKSILESSNGKIWFESEENKGTTFWFSLPISGMIAKEGQVSIT